MADVQHHVLAAIPAETVNPRMTRRLFWGQRLMGALIELKAGASVPVHQHDNEQISYCISGAMRFILDGRELVLRPGEVLVIPGGVPHGAEVLEDTVEMDFFTPPREDWITGRDAYLRR
ncbi:MAG: cupin domain-containing protein [Armatimonadota bacterium]|nr:cupin domain-containing protein [Armatimonadota bacterium]MDR7421553.1 cupin domain-containing protein [Armatimonadota bacterium]MDR7454525.1 cupin domain-containing protein [Armatimonadota bacterium]MDR7456746.1 cupin domain-containing protein [Armatimonadota bacterium]MDR7497460.1 cupin domain-containing protein [Armatimonadota bacterium]